MSLRKSPTQIATEALQEIARHEEECGLRWKEATTEIKNLSKQVSDHADRWEKLAWLIVSALIAGAVALFWKNIT